MLNPICPICNAHLVKNSVGDDTYLIEAYHCYNQGASPPGHSEYRIHLKVDGNISMSIYYDDFYIFTEKVGVAGSGVQNTIRIYYNDYKHNYSRLLALDYFVDFRELNSKEEIRNKIKMLLSFS